MPGLPDRQADQTANLVGLPDCQACQVVGMRVRALQQNTYFGVEIQLSSKSSCQVNPFIQYISSCSGLYVVCILV